MNSSPAGLCAELRQSHISLVDSTHVMFHVCVCSSLQVTNIMTKKETCEKPDTTKSPGLSADSLLWRCENQGFLKQLLKTGLNSM